MIDIERRIFVDKNTFSMSYPRFHVEIKNYTVNITYTNAKNENKTFSRRFQSLEECFAAAEQLSEHQGILEEFEKELKKVLNYEELL
jgi:galactokinase